MVVVGAVVATGVLANGVTLILKKLSSVVANEITLIWDFNGELKNLQSTLNMIIAVMEDAENKQVSNASVRLWMEDLKAIAYDAEDVLDEYYYEVILRKREKEEYNSTVLNKVRNVFSSSKPISFVASWKLARKVKKINKKFNKIAKRKNDLGLLTIEVGSSSSQHELMMKNRETNSLVVTDWKFVGRENDKSNIIKMLLKEEEEEEEKENSSNNQGDGGKNVSVIPIMGMGGLGKTTIAQQVYNEKVVQNHFKLKIWICVSDPFDIKKLWENIANSIKIPIDDLACSLQNAFRGKKFILVLDDVWNEKPADWNNFKKPFMVGEKGSKILVTTRNEKVALLMVDKFPPYPLGILKENDCWSLFKQIAFGSAVGAVETPKLMEIGEEMVKRCGGLPLAVIFLGSLMRSKKKEEEWKTIRDTRLWHESREGKNSEILPSLRLSYDYLSSHLKLCFSYCCLFPKDWEIHRETLIQLWMAEGFIIETPGEAMSMEEIGNEYFHSLVSSFFFQVVRRNDYGDIVTCKMHDLVHDLARSVVGNHECLIVENAHDIANISEATRRLNLWVNLDDEEMLPKVLEALKRAKKLRTVFVINKQKIGFDIGNAFKENKRLRVLDLSGMGGATELPTSSSIGGLKHLKYLSVFGVLFPKGIGRLSFLETLTSLEVGDKKLNKNACGIEELEDLNLLRGDIFIYHLQNVTSVTEACRANLKKKKNLRGLDLSWEKRYTNNDDAICNHEAVLEGFRPHPNLRKLDIGGFEGAKLPKWIEDSSCLPNLVKLTLFNGMDEQLPGFGALPSLGYLCVWSMDKLECVGNELYYSAADGGGESRSNTASTTTIAFPSLKKLTLQMMPLWKEWVVPAVSPPQASTTTATGATTNYCFPLLEEITITRCPLLSTITPTTTIFPSLKVLDLSNINGRAAKPLVTNHLNSLTSLTLHNISSLITLPRQGLMENNNTLLSLSIESCDKFEGFRDEDDDDQGGRQQVQISLQSLKLYRCPVLRLFPDILRSLTSLRALEIQECKESKSLQDELTCPYSSSSSSLKHLEHVKILNKNRTLFEEVVYEWRKSSS